MSEQAKKNPSKAICEAYNSSLESIHAASKSAATTEKLASVTAGDDGTYYYYVTMDGYKQLHLQLVITAGSGSVTTTLEGTVQDDGTAQASCTYVDITNTTYGAASYTASAVLIDSSSKVGALKYARIKVVANTSGANDGGWIIYSKKMF
jgi:hypothetical protein